MEIAALIHNLDPVISVDWVIGLIGRGIGETCLVVYSLR